MGVRESQRDRVFSTHGETRYSHPRLGSAGKYIWRSVPTIKRDAPCRARARTLTRGTKSVSTMLAGHGGVGPGNRDAGAPDWQFTDGLETHSSAMSFRPTPWRLARARPHGP